MPTGSVQGADISAQYCIFTTVHKVTSFVRKTGETDVLGAAGFEYIALHECMTEISNIPL